MGIFVDGHLGIAFLWGLVTQSTFIPSQSGFLYAFFQVQFHSCTMYNTCMYFFLRIVRCFFSAFKYLLYNIPLTIYLAWKADKVISEQKSPTDVQAEEALNVDEDEKSCCKNQEADDVQQSQPACLRILQAITNNKFFIALNLFHAFQIVITIVFSGLLSAIIAPVRTWCVPLAVYLRYRVGLLTNTDLEF